VEFRIEQRFAAPLAAVEAAQLDAAFIARLTNLPKIGHAELVDQNQDGTIVDQEIRYVFVGDLSAAVRAVVDPRKLSWILESQYDLETHRSTWRILPDHYGERLTAHGTTQLTPDGDSTRRVNEGVVVVHMALVGGRVERAIVSGLKEHAEAEAGELGRFLSERGG
jgi:hypothetical protein